MPIRMRRKGEGSRKVYRGKAWHLEGWAAGETEATVQVPCNPGQGRLSPRPLYRPDTAKLQMGLGQQ